MEKFAIFLTKELFVEKYFNKTMIKLKLFQGKDELSKNCEHPRNKNNKRFVLMKKKYANIDLYTNFRMYTLQIYTKNLCYKIIRQIYKVIHYKFMQMSKCG